VNNLNGSQNQGTRDANLGKSPLQPHQHQTWPQRNAYDAAYQKEKQRQEEIRRQQQSKGR
jgi:hypothetical protein